ncbi:hypothetical protein IE4872_CH03472 [Rhizobium gallicum]|uniref:Uncharacterized protein n=1 Tax=Rhizobium gallicum TaxID=56730 RepID=A0A1L5NME1_9HYPH|nr:hypothetical protein IE4872_CH03472 [Rhizobium gallicum]
MRPWHVLAEQIALDFPETSFLSLLSYSFVSTPSAGVAIEARSDADCADDGENAGIALDTGQELRSSLILSKAKARR